MNYDNCCSQYINCFTESKFQKYEKQKCLVYILEFYIIEVKFPRSNELCLLGFRAFNTLSILYLMKLSWN